MRQTFPPLPVGQSLLRASLPGIGEIHGIIIDNPSGQWLYVQPIRDYVPPYTLGWSRTFPTGVVTFDVFAGQSPAGQISTQQGDPVTITIDSEPVGTSQGATSGSEFVESFTPILIARSNGILNSNSPTGLTIIIAAVPLKRIRIYTFAASYSGSDPSQNHYQDSPCVISLQDTQGIGNLYDLVGLSRDMPSASRVYQGLDYPVGYAVAWGGGADFANIAVQLTLTYSVI